MMRERANCKAKRRRRRMSASWRRSWNENRCSPAGHPCKFFWNFQQFCWLLRQILEHIDQVSWRKQQESRHGTRSRSIVVADRRATSRNHFDCALLASLGNVSVFLNEENNKQK
jgi:hypothetical protein